MNHTERTSLKGVLLHDHGVLLGLTHGGVWELPGIDARPPELPATVLGDWLTALVGATIRVGVMMEASPHDAACATTHLLYRCHLAQLWAQQLSRNELNWELPCPEHFRLLMFVDGGELNDLVMHATHRRAVLLASMVEAA